MIAIKARYLKHGEAIGKDYVFACNFLPKLGDIVKAGKAKAVVTEVDTSDGAVYKYDGELRVAGRGGGINVRRNKRIHKTSHGNIERIHEERGIVICNRSCKKRFQTIRASALSKRSTYFKRKSRGNKVSIR